jgi:hypothetical protein
VSGRRFAQPVGGQLDGVAHGQHLIRVERGKSQALGLQVAQRGDGRGEHFARFGFRQGRLGERGSKRIVGVFEDGVDDDFVGEFGAPAVQ